MFYLLGGIAILFIVSSNRFASEMTVKKGRHLPQSAKVVAVWLSNMGEGLIYRCVQMFGK